VNGAGLPAHAGAALMPSAEAAAAWPARLALHYGAVDGCTRLVGRHHSGPLTVQKPFYPEGPSVCHSVVLHPPGGLAGGDLLQVDVVLDTGARGVITTPGATKWYRSAGPAAEQRVTLRVGPGASVEWLPQENIVFDRARARMQSIVHLDEGAVYLGWDITCLGRTASGECFRTGEVRNRTEISQGKHRLWADYARIEGGAALMSSPAGLAGYPVLGTLLAAGCDISGALLEACRAVQPEGDARFGITAFPGMLAARLLGHSTEVARRYFVGLWRLLRPELMGREATLPRIWST
jgi:urease accessory protein